MFASTSETGAIVETVDRNTFKRGIGGFSCNGFEAVISNGGGTIDVTLRNSTFEDNPGGPALRARQPAAARSPSR